MRKETIQGNGTYWYGYRSLQRRTIKRYLGRTADLSLTRLEKVAASFIEPGNVKPLNESEPEQATFFSQIPPLEAKLHPPRLPQALVERPRLYALLDAWPLHKLTLLSAPAGSGKTTLVNAWLKQRSFNSVAWISLDASDNDPIRFWYYLLTSCKDWTPNMQQQLLSLLHSTNKANLQPHSLESVLSHFLNHLHKEPSLLILEDYHVISEPRIHETFGFLLTYLPETFLWMAEEGWQGDHAELGKVFSFRAFLSLQQGAREQALTWARQALAWLPDEEVIWRGMSLIALGLDALQMGHLHEARPLFQEIHRRGKMPPNPQFLDGMTMILGMICLAQGDLYQLVRYALLRGDHMTAQHWIDDLARLHAHPVAVARLLTAPSTSAKPDLSQTEAVSFQQEAPISPVLQEGRALLMARLHLARGEVEIALPILHHLLPEAHAAGRGYTTFQIKLLLAQAYAIRKQSAEARQILLEGLEQGYAGGFQRSFLDEGDQLFLLLHDLFPHLQQPPIQEYVQTLFRAFRQMRRETRISPEIQTLFEQLSKQEQRVLRLLVAGRSNQEIAQELVVSINTIRTQVQSIYRKLQVNNRQAASEIARNLNLL